MPSRFPGGLETLPTTFMVGPEGKILRRYVGATPEQIEGLIADVEAKLEGRQLPTMVIPEISNAVADR